MKNYLLSFSALLFGLMLFVPIQSILAFESVDSVYTMYENTTASIFYDVLEGSDGTLVGVGTDGVIAVSIDGGTNWDVTTRSSNIQFQVSESDYGFVVVGRNGEIYTSEDSGDSWQTMTTGTTTDFYSVDCSGDYCVAVGDAGLFMVSGDGGQSWSLDNVSMAVVGSCW
jgi:hypothetical protein